MSEVHSPYQENVPSWDNEIKVVLLPKDPNWLFAYWEFPEEKKSLFIQEFGHELWERSVPVLKIVNVSRNTSFYIRLNDFSNSWYINVPDGDSLYVAELGRKVSDRFFINLADSNYVSTPGENTSSNASVYFIDYKELRNGRPEIEAVSGTGPVEFLRAGTRQPLAGISSAGLFGINLQEHVGFSSESIFR